MPLLQSLAHWLSSVSPYFCLIQPPIQHQLVINCRIRHSLVLILVFKDHLGDMAILAAPIFGRGVASSWLIGRRCPETPPKVPGIHEATFSGPNSKFMKALKKCAHRPLRIVFYSSVIISIFFSPFVHSPDTKTLSSTSLLTDVSFKAAESYKARYPDIQMCYTS